MSLSPLTHRLLDRPGVRHGFFTREGGVSTGIYASLNVGMGSADDPAHVAENRARIAAHFDQPPSRLATVYQVHSARVVVASPDFRDRSVEADALVTDQPGLVLGVLTADCAPVLFADAEACVIGAAHAGWKGALAGILEATVQAMVDLGAQTGRITAGVGPTIGPESYEVSEGFEAPFLAHDFRAAGFFTAAARPQKLRFDLPGYCLWRLGAAGVGSAAWTGHDTCADAARFYSNRRAHRAGEPDFGRLMSAIALT